MTDKPKRYSNLSANPSDAVKAKMRQFADLYRGGPDDVRGNATACYMAIHPKIQTKSAQSKGHGYLQHPYTQEYLREHTDAAAKEADITQERVLKEVARIGLFDPRKLFDNVGNPLPIAELDDDVAAAISGLKVVQMGGKDGEEGIGSVIEYKIADKNSALEKLMKYLGAYEKDNAQKAKSLQELIAEVRGGE